MSIESFISKYPADPDVRKTVEQIKAREGKRDKSLIVILAEQLIRECRDGIREQLNRINPGSTMFVVDPITFRQIPEEDRQKMIVEYNGIVFGVLVRSIESALVERKIDHDYVRENYNLAVEGLQLSDMQIRKIEENRELSGDQLRRMYSIARQDPTFARFVETQEGIEALPDVLRRFLTETGALSIIRQNILPPWKERAKFVTPHQDYLQV